jgi:hypothetical protein
MKMRTCLDTTSFKVDECPTAQGALEGSDENELEFRIKVSEGAKVLTAQGFTSAVDTTVKAETGDDAKLDHFDIKHVYKRIVTLGGAKQKFGPMSLDTTFLGDARIDMRGSSQPPKPDVSVSFSAAGLDPYERVQVEIELAHQAQKEADENFAAEIEKVTNKLRGAESHWLEPNKCAKVSFEPVSESLKLQKGDTGTVKSRVEANSGGAPPTAKWTPSEQQNATFTPAGSEGNPLSSAYNVTNAGSGIVVSAKFRATSRAGVAEDTWHQKTGILIKTVSGTFSGHYEHEGEKVEWEGSASYARNPESPPDASVLLLVSGEATVTVSGNAIGTGCNQTGKEALALSPSSVWTVQGTAQNEGPPFIYMTTSPFGFPGRIKTTWIECSEPNNDGVESSSSAPLAAVQTGDPLRNGPTALEQTSSADGLTYSGSASMLGLEGETIEWTWSMTGTT